MTNTLSLAGLQHDPGRPSMEPPVHKIGVGISAIHMDTWVNPDNSNILSNALPTCTPEEPSKSYLPASYCGLYLPPSPASIQLTEKSGEMRFRIIQFA